MVGAVSLTVQAGLTVSCAMAAGSCLARWQLNGSTHWKQGEQVSHAT